MPPRRYGILKTERISATITPQCLLKLILLCEEWEESLSGALDRVVQEYEQEPKDWDRISTQLQSYLAREKGNFADFLAQYVPNRLSAYEKRRRRLEKLQKFSETYAQKLGERGGKTYGTHLAHYSYALGEDAEEGDGDDSN